MKKLPPNATTYTAITLILVGLVMIFLGWNGAAGAEAAVDLRRQFPYLISGGLFGLALVGAGLMLVRVFEGRRDTVAVIRHLERLTLAVERLEQAQTAPLLAAANEREHAQVLAVPPVAPPFERAQ
jgi:hypothetical protein